MKILLIDDDIFFQKFYSAKLRAEGHQVDVASNGQEALDYLAQKKPELILLDLIMPYKDGFEVLKARAADPTLKTIPVIVFSTLSQPQDVERARQLGASEFVNKSSLNFTILTEKIRSLDKGGQTL